MSPTTPYTSPTTATWRNVIRATTFTFSVFITIMTYVLTTNTVSYITVFTLSIVSNSISAGRIPFCT
jgi:hypothetical protein